MDSVTDPTSEDVLALHIPTQPPPVIITNEDSVEIPINLNLTNSTLGFQNLFSMPAFNSLSSLTGSTLPLFATNSDSLNGLAVQEEIVLPSLDNPSSSLSNSLVSYQSQNNQPTIPIIQSHPTSSVISSQVLDRTPSEPSNLFNLDTDEILNSITLKKSDKIQNRQKHSPSKTPTIISSIPTVVGTKRKQRPPTLRQSALSLTNNVEPSPRWESKKLQIRTDTGNEFAFTMWAPLQSSGNAVDSSLGHHMHGTYMLFYDSFPFLI